MVSCFLARRGYQVRKNYGIISFDLFFISFFSVMTPLNCVSYISFFSIFVVSGVNQAGAIRCWNNNKEKEVVKKKIKDVIKDAIYTL